MVKIYKKFMTNNPNYKWNSRRGTNQSPDKIIIHSTAVQGVMAKDWFSRWNNTSRNVGVHYFVDDKEAYYYIPENYRGWHVGGAWNVNSVGIEACEDKGHTKAYFDKMIKNYIELVVDIIKRNPKIKVSDIYSHTEAGNKGVGTKSSDPVNHWWHKFNYNMNDFRNDVKKALRGGNVTVTKPIKPTQSTSKPSPNGKLTVDGWWGKDTTRALQKVLLTPVDGVIGGQYRNIYTLPIPSASFNNRKGSPVIVALQKLIGTKADGYIGKNTLLKLQSHLGTYQDGLVSRPSNMVKEMQRRLNSGTFIKKLSTKTVGVKAGVNVRAGAGTNYKKAMNALPYGTKVNVIGEYNGWHKINYNGKEGYIRKDLIK